MLMLDFVFVMDWCLVNVCLFFNFFFKLNGLYGSVFFVCKGWFIILLRKDFKGRSLLMVFFLMGILKSFFSDWLSFDGFLFKEDDFFFFLFYLNGIFIYNWFFYYFFNIRFF